MNIKKIRAGVALVWAATFLGFIALAQCADASESAVKPLEFWIERADEIGRSACLVGLGEPKEDEDGNTHGIMVICDPDGGWTLLIEVGGGYWQMLTHGSDHSITYTVPGQKKDS